MGVPPGVCHFGGVSVVLQDNNIVHCGAHALIASQAVHLCRYRADHSAPPPPFLHSWPQILIMPSLMPNPQALWQTSVQPNLQQVSPRDIYENHAKLGWGVGVWLPVDMSTYTSTGRCPRLAVNPWTCHGSGVHGLPHCAVYLCTCVPAVAVAVTVSGIMTADGHRISTFLCLLFALVPCPASKHNISQDVGLGLRVVTDGYVDLQTCGPVDP